MIVNIESKDGGFYSTNTDLTLHYYDGDLSHATVSSPTLLSFKVPDKYEDGGVLQKENFLIMLKKKLKSKNYCFSF